MYVPGNRSNKAHESEQLRTCVLLQVMTFLFMMVTGAQTIQYFIPTLAKNMGYKGTMAQYMTIPVSIKDKWSMIL